MRGAAGSGLRWAAVLLFASKAAFCLKLYEVNIPRNILQGEDTHLACLYDLGGGQLYAIKWYKDGKEFYRFEPSNPLPKKSFPKHGIEVDLDASNATHVRLSAPTLRYSGRYVCEVSLEKPTFITEHGKGTVHVVVFPSDGPVITGGKSRYELGDRVNVNCTSYRSRPAARLTWYINGELASLKRLKLWPPTVDSAGLQTVTVGLRFLVRPSHLRTGNLRLKCVCQLADAAQPLFWRSREQLSRRAAGTSAARDSRCSLCQLLARWTIFIVSVYLAR